MTSTAECSILLDDELGVPQEATLQPTAIRARLETDGGVSIPLSSETCNRSNGRCWFVGRQKTADIRIQHKSISRKHAVIYVVNNRIFLKNFAGGKHGTTVNNQKLVKSPAAAPEEDDSVLVELKGGDTILFGNVRESVFRVEIKSLDVEEQEKAPSKSQGGEETDQPISAQGIIEKAGEGLTGRAKRQAEIEAMMSSLDQNPVYQKQNIPDPDPVDDPTTKFGGGSLGGSANDEQQTETDAVTLKAIERHNLPVSNRFTIPSESERKNAAACVSIDPPGSRFAVGSSDTRLRLYDFGGMDRRRVGPFKEIIPDDGYLIVDCAFSNTGDRLIVGTSSVQPRVLGREGDEIIKFMRGDMYVTDQAKTVGHTAAVTNVDWHPLERDLVLTSSLDGSVRLWNLNGKTQFQMLVCDKVFQAKSERGQRTAVKSVCFHPGGREFALGTVCGSIQVWNRSRVSGRPERAVYGAHGDSRKPIDSLAYSVDGSELVSRSSDDDTVKVWNAQRLSRSSTPLAVCSGLGTVHENSNACFSPNGKIVCAGSSDYEKGPDGKRVERGSLKFYNVVDVSGTGAGPVVEPIIALNLDGHSTPVITKWHQTLNQIFVGCSDGGIIVFYDPSRSKKGALLPAAKVGRGVDGLSELLRSRAPQGSAAISGDIVTPFSLPMYRDNTVSEKKRKRQERKDPVLSKEPERPATGKHKTGGQAGGGVSFQQFVAQSSNFLGEAIAGKDPREALLRYKGEGNEDKSRKLADKTAEEEEEELRSKKS